MLNPNDREKIAQLLSQLHDLINELKRKTEIWQRDLESLEDRVEGFSDWFKVKPGMLVYSHLFDKNTFPSKASILHFVKRYYFENIPERWDRPRIEKRALEIIQRHEDPARFREILSKFQKEKFETPRVDIHSMTLEEIQKEFENQEKYPDVQSIKAALEPGFKKLLKDVTRREYAIKRILDEVGRLRSVSRILGS